MLNIWFIPTSSVDVYLLIAAAAKHLTKMTGGPHSSKQIAATYSAKVKHMTAIDAGLRMITLDQA